MWGSPKQTGNEGSPLAAPPQARPISGTVSVQGSGGSLNCVTVEPPGRLRTPVIGITPEVSLLVMHVGGWILQSLLCVDNYKRY